MKKRLTAIILAALLALSFTACSSIEEKARDALSGYNDPSGTDTPGGSDSTGTPSGGNAGESSASAGGNAADSGNMLSLDDSRYRFWDVFDEVRDKLDAALENPNNNVEESYYYGMLLTTFSTMNMMFIPLYYIDDDEYFENGEKDGWTNIEREQKGNLRTVSFMKPDSGANTYAAEYDGALDSLKITFTNNHFNILWEYVRVGDGYVSQMYQGSPDIGETGMVYSMFFDKQNILLATVSDAPMPASIYKKSGLSSSFVQVPTTMFSNYISYMNGTLEVTSN